MRKFRDRPSRSISNFMTGQNRWSDPSRHIRINRDGHPNLNLDPTWPDFSRDFIPLEISRPCLLGRNLPLSLIWAWAICLIKNGNSRIELPDYLQLGMLSLKTRALSYCKPKIWPGPMSLSIQVTLSERIYAFNSDFLSSCQVKAPDLLWNATALRFLFKISSRG